MAVTGVVVIASIVVLVVVGGTTAAKTVGVIKGSAMALRIV